MYARLTCAILVLGLGAGAVAAAEKNKEVDAIPENPAKPRPGIEGGSWSLESWGNSGTNEKRIEKGRARLKFIYTSGEKEKTAFKHLTGLTASPEGKVQVHIYSPEEKPPQVSLAISTTPAYIWHETKPFELKKGWNTLEAPLAKPHWKSLATSWKLSTGVEHLDDIRAVDLIFWNAQSTGWVLVEGLDADPDEAGKKVAALIKDLTSDDPEKRALAEAGLVAVGRPALEALYQVRNSDRPEVLLRAGWALRKIESAQEELPKDPEIRTQMIKQREQNFFIEAKVRADYVLKSLQGEREKVQKLVKDARDEIARGKLEMQKLETTAEEDKKAYATTLEDLEKISRALQAGFEQVVELEKKEQEKKELEKKELEKKEAEMKKDEKSAPPVEKSPAQQNAAPLPPGK